MKEGPKKKKRVTLWISLLLFEFNHLGQLLFSTHQDSKIIIILFGFCTTSYNEMEKKRNKILHLKTSLFSDIHRIQIVQNNCSIINRGGDLILHPCF